MAASCAPVPSEEGFVLLLPLLPSWPTDPLLLLAGGAGGATVLTRRHDVAVSSRSQDLNNVDLSTADESTEQQAFLLHHLELISP